MKGQKNIFKKWNASDGISKLKEEREHFVEYMTVAANAAGYSSVADFMKAYKKMSAAIEKYKRDYAAYEWTVSAGESIVRQSEPESVRKKIQRYGGKAKGRDEARELGIVTNRSRQKEPSL